MADGTRRWADQFKWIHNPNRSEGSVIAIGDSNQRLPVKAASRPMAQMYVTSALTSGTVDILKIDWTQTADTTGYQKGIRATITASSGVKLGSSAKCVYGSLVPSTEGSTGYGAALAADVTLPNGSLVHGGLYGLDINLIGQASSSWASAGPVAFIKFNAAGTALPVETGAYLFHLDGIGAATAGEIFDTCVATPPSHSLKILIGTTPYYILLTNNVDDT